MIPVDKNEETPRMTRRSFVKNSASVAVAASCLAGFAGLDVPTAGFPVIEGYVCPPCGQECDKLRFDKPGKCPQCGMTLISADVAKETTPTVAVLLFNAAQIIDFAGPWEVFGAAGYRIFSVTETADPITAVYGQKITADYTFANCPNADVLLVPGGGVANAVNDGKLISWVIENAARSKQVMSVCTGAFILAKAGLLDGLTATTVRGGIDNLAKAGSNIKVVHDKRFVDNGKIITTAGLSAGIDGAFHVVAKMLGKVAAQQAALGIEYDWDPDAKFARAAYADRYLPNFQGLDGKITSIDGDTHRWKTAALITNPTTVDGIVDLVQKQVLSSTPYVTSPVSITRKPTKSLGKTTFDWTFKDELSRTWSGSCSVSESVTEKGKFDLVVRVEKI